MISVYHYFPREGTKKPIQKAFNVSYQAKSNSLWSGGFSLPANDPMTDKLKQFSFVELWDGDERVELFVIVKSTESFGSSVPVVKYELLDALFILNLSVIEFMQLVNPTTKEALEAVLDCQYVPYWVLDECDFSRGFSYSWENENGLLSPLMSVLGDTGEQYHIVRNTTSFPFKLSFKRMPEVETARIREAYNLKGFTVAQEGKNIVNWILPKGNAEGINAVDIAKINNGQRYLMDADSMQEFMPAQTIWVDGRYSDEENLKASAQSKLDVWKQPAVNWDVSAVDLSRLITPPDNLEARKGLKVGFNRFNLDDLVIVHTKKYGNLRLRITEKGKSDVTGKPGDIILKIVDEKVNPEAYDTKRQQEIAKVTSNGAQNMLPFVFDREADPDNPVEFSIPIYDEVVNVNDCRLWLKTTNFRATSKANKSAPQSVSSSTSSSGGASVQSATSEASGQSTQTSSANGSHRHTAFKYGGEYNSDTWPVADRYYWGLGDTNAIILRTTQAVDIETNSAADNHTHSVTTPAHSHNVSITIPAHTHNVSITIPGHTHEIEYGIFKYQKLPSTVEIWIDDNKLPISATSADGFDMKDYMRRGSDGKITRDNHTLKIKPNDLARFEITIILTIFIKSRLGGKF